MGNKTKSIPASFRGVGWNQTPLTGYRQALEGVVRTFGYTRVAGDNPKFRVLIKAGVNAANGMSITVTNGETTNMRHKIYLRLSGSPSSPDYSTIWTYGFDGVPTQLAPLVLLGHEGSSSLVQACDIANRVMQRKRTARRRQVMGGVVLGELGKTLKMVSSPAKALRGKATTLISRLTKVKKRATRGASLTKALADTWLETTFGWKPLLADMKDGATALARLATRDALERQQFRAFGEVPNFVSSFQGSVQVQCGPGGTYVINLLGEGSTVRYSQCILYGMWATKIQDATRAHSTAKRLATLSGFNWEDVIPQAWELVPWSFLVDYFTNVGDVLEAYASVFDQPLWIEEVDIEETRVSRNYNVDPQYLKTTWPGTYLTHEGATVARKYSYRTITRKAFDWAKFFPSLKFSLPQDMQWLNIAALIAGGRSFQPFTHR